MRSMVAGLMVVGLFLAVGMFTTGCDNGSSSDSTSAATTNAPALVAPTQIAPANGESLDHFPRSTTLVWSSVDGAVKYGVEVEYNDGSWHGLVDTTVANPTHTFNFIGMNPGRWRVWAIDSDGNEGPKTGWFEFKYTI
jgi:eukaryotic-like serine/threonine-protein kinase